MRDAILAGVATIANTWQVVAVAWHVVAAGLIVMLWRSGSLRAIAALLAAMALSVAVLAEWAGNPFNAIVFGVTGTLMFALALTTADSHRPQPAVPLVAGGVILCAFGWVYPHFLSGPSWQYAYAAPLGLIPCPTLAFIMGVSLLTNSFDSRLWAALLAVLGLFYGVIGVFVLGVTIDWLLIIGAALLARSRASVRWPSSIAVEPEKRHV